MPTKITLPTADTTDKKKGINYAPWEKALDRAFSPFDEFIHKQTTSGSLLMATAAVALILANSAMAEFYTHLVHTPIGITIGSFTLEKSLHHWVNDGLMTLFFFLVGLELKREIMVGELSQPRQAALPIIAAIGGMVAPALCFYALNQQGGAVDGWGIPMATDIAFAIGVLALLGTRIPKSLVTFLVALAIVDDLGAVVMIALFYTDEIIFEALFAGAGLLLILVGFHQAGIRSPLPYFIIGTLLWLALLKSGVHATLAGVLTALTIPSKPKYDANRFCAKMNDTLGKFREAYKPGDSIITNQRLATIVQKIEAAVHKVETPLSRLEHSLHIPVAMIVIPIFALINAGIPIDFAGIGNTLSHPVTLGVTIGLVVGKFVGIAGSSFIALKLGIGDLPAGTTYAQILGVSILGGIGFTMSIFIAELAYANAPDYLLMAKTGILAASLIAGIVGYIWLLIATKPKPETATS
jgi:NhaA family Na+:H+ antiporter